MTCRYDWILAFVFIANAEGINQNSTPWKTLTNVTLARTTLIILDQNITETKGTTESVISITARSTSNSSNFDLTDNQVNFGTDKLQSGVNSTTDVLDLESNNSNSPPKNGRHPWTPQPGTKQTTDFFDFRTDDQSISDLENGDLTQPPTQPPETTATISSLVPRTIQNVSASVSNQLLLQPGTIQPEIGPSKASGRNQSVATSINRQFLPRPTSQTGYSTTTSVLDSTAETEITQLQPNPSVSTLARGVVAQPLINPAAIRRQPMANNTPAIKTIPKLDVNDEQVKALLFEMLKKLLKENSVEKTDDVYTTTNASLVHNGTEGTPILNSENKDYLNAIYYMISFLFFYTFIIFTCMIGIRRHSFEEAESRTFFKEFVLEKRLSHQASEKKREKAQSYWDDIRGAVTSGFLRSNGTPRSAAFSNSLRSLKSVSESPGSSVKSTSLRTFSSPLPLPEDESCAMASSRSEADDNGSHCTYEFSHRSLDSLESGIVLGVSDAKLREVSSAPTMTAGYWNHSFKHSTIKEEDESVVNATESEDEIF